MSIVYIGIFSSQGCLSYSSKDNRINGIIEALVSGLDLEIDNNRSFGANPNCFNYSIQIKITDRHAYATACTSTLNHMVAFKYLQHIVYQHKSYDVYTIQGKSDFENYITRTMETAPEDPLYNPLAPTRKQVEDLTNIMTDNIRLAINRGQTLTDITDRSEKLSSQSNIFSKTAKAVKCAMIKNNLKTTIILILIILFFLALTAAALYIVITY